MANSSDTEYHGKTFQGTVNMVVDLAEVDEEFLSDILVLPDTLGCWTTPWTTGCEWCRCPMTAPLVSMNLAFQG